MHPFVVTNLANAIIGVQGKSKTINCTFKAKPAPTVKWFMKETLLLNGSRIQIHTRTEHGSSSMAHVESSITITNVMLEDAGNIRCEATLSFGNASSATKFLVHCKFSHAYFILKIQMTWQRRIATEMQQKQP